MSDNRDYRKVLNHGHVVLESWSGDDLSIVNAARTSFNQESDVMDERNIGVLNFLMKNNHATPFEMVWLKFDVKAPIFVFREWHRHRTASINEWSARYSKLEPEFYVPDLGSVTRQVGKPGSYTFEQVGEDEARDAQTQIEVAQKAAYSAYEQMLDAGIAKQLARVVLPVGIYSRMKWAVNLRNCLHFLSLRNDDHAQYEIRQYAIQMEAMLHHVVPHTMKSWVENGRRL